MERRVLPKRSQARRTELGTSANGAMPRHERSLEDSTRDVQQASTGDPQTPTRNRLQAPKRTQKITATKSIIQSRLGYQNPNSIAKELRLFQVQASMSVGDTEQDALSVARSVKSYGGNVLVASSGGYLSTQLSRFDVLHATVELNRRGPVVDRVNKHRVERLAREFRANLVVARSRAPAQAARATAKALKLPFVSYFHSLYDIGSDRQAKYNGCLASGDKVVVPSLFMADHVKRFYGVEKHRLEIIPRGVDLQRFNQHAIDYRAIANLKDELGLVSNRPIAVMAGRLSFWKGHHLFVEAIKRLENLNLYGLIFAYGDKEKDYGRDLKKLIEKWDVSNRLKVIEVPYDMPLVYAMADVVVSASIEPEGFTRSIAEAMAMGKACIAPNHGASVEQIDHHETGWLVPPANVNALTQAIQEALGLTLEQKQNLSAWATEAAREKHDIKKVCDREVDLFLSLVAQ